MHASSLLTLAMLAMQQAREGSVRSGVKPDFHPPLGNLGKVGLAKGAPHLPAQALAIAPKTVAGQSALAFGDASFQPSTAPDREGSVRDGKRPDFKPPLGTLGETGLASSKATSLVEEKKEEAQTDKKETAVEVRIQLMLCADKTDSLQDSTRASSPVLACVCVYF
jgi:hypothetical protein